MKGIEIVHRELTEAEIEQVNMGFDMLSTEEGVALESTERMSVIAMRDNKLVGCASGLAHKNGDRYSGWFHLTDLFIEKECRDQGIGSELLKALEDQSKAIGVQNIWLWTSGAATIRFYNRHGYRQFTEMENWYSDGSSRVGFRKTLTQQN